MSFLKKIGFLFFFLGFALFAFADRYSHLELFAQTLNIIKQNYFKSVEIKTLIYGAIKGLLREIDPYSQFLLPKDLEGLKEITQGQFYGLGIEVEKKEDFLTVIAVLQDSPAGEAGLQKGDKIVKINHTIVQNFSREDFRRLFKNHMDKNYKITVVRTGYPEPLIFRLQTRILRIPSIDFKELQKGLFYIRIYYFSKKTLFEMNTFFKNKKIKGLILDLRGNPGGMFEQSVKVADLFLDEGVIVSYKIRAEKKAKKFKAHYFDTLPFFPLVVLIDEYSASASEIVAGALKDHKRALLIGRKTFGKGSIQKVFLLTKGHGLKLTVGKYQTPSGSVIHEKGIEPDIQIDRQKLPVTTKMLSAKSILQDPEIHQALEALKSQSR